MLVHVCNFNVELVNMSVKVTIIFITLGMTFTLASFHKHDCNIDSSDFYEISRTCSFVDKTLLIEEFLKGPKIIMLTSPRRFGKSTNLNMIKRFLEINVDENGIPRNQCETANYEIFSRNELLIYKSKHVFEDNFGNHPVLHIDLNNLKEITNFESLLEKIRTVLLNSFEQHIYLIESNKIWSEDLTGNQFIKYIHPTHHLSLSTAEIRAGFKQLLLLLRNHFGKNSYVLIDNYDSYVESLIFKKDADADIVLTFVQSIISEILNSDELVERVLMAGVLRVHQDWRRGSITEYSFQNDHPFSKYFGFTSEDVTRNLMNFEANSIEERGKYILDYYNGYATLGSNLKLYCIWSVLNYLYKDTNVNCYRCRQGFVSLFKYILNLKEIADPINKLLEGKSVRLVTLHSFTTDDILKLNELFTSGELKYEEIKHLFLSYLYQLGYFTPDITCPSKDGELCVKLPNKEVYFELKNMMVKRS